MSDGTPSGFGMPEIVMVSPSITAVEWGEMSFAEIPQFQREARARVDAALAAQGIEKVSPEVTFSLPPSGDRIRIAAGSTIAGGFRTTDHVTVQEIPGGRAGHLRLEGPHTAARRLAGADGLGRRARSRTGRAELGGLRRSCRAGHQPLCAAHVALSATGPLGL